jgi:hypothetical protein
MTSEGRHGVKSSERKKEVGSSRFEVGGLKGRGSNNPYKLFIRDFAIFPLGGYGFVMLTEGLFGPLEKKNSLASGLDILCPHRKELSIHNLRVVAPRRGLLKSIFSKEQEDRVFYEIQVHGQ